MIAELEALRWTGRKGYGSRVLVGACLAKSLYAIPTWTRTVALVREHDGLREAIGGCPSVYACYRFATKLRAERPILDACLDRVAASLRAEVPDLGRDVAIDASDMPAYANGQRFVSKGGRERARFSDPDASWGHRSAVSTRKGGGFYGFKLHAACCARTGLPLAWRVESARTHEAALASTVMDAVLARGFQPETCAMDNGYDVTPVYDACHARGIIPVMPLRETPAVKRGDHLAPACEHGTWTFAGTDFKRKATKWRCPSSECSPKSVWIRADNRGRAAVEREFGRLKHEYGLAPLRVRGLERVALHADLTMLARLSGVLARIRAMPLAA